MLPYLRRNNIVQRCKPLLKPVYSFLARIFNFIFYVVVYLATQILRFIFGIELINTILFWVPKPFIKPILRTCGCKIGKNTDILPHVIIANAKAGNYANLAISDGCFVGKNVYFDLVEPISLGANSTVSARVTILTHEDPGPCNKLKEAYPRKSAKVVIGENAWIGACATILSGVIIGDNTIIGASSLVREDISASCVAVGVPAKVIKKIEN